MSHFVLICRDKAGAIDTRLATRPAHGAYVATGMVNEAAAFAASRI